MFDEDEVKYFNVIIGFYKYKVTVIPSGKYKVILINKYSE